MINFVEAVEIELKKKTPEELSKTIIEQATRIIVLEKTIDKAIQQLDNIKFCVNYEKTLCKALTEIQDILKGSDE